MGALGGLDDTLVIIDEAQRMPALFPVLRVLVDANRRPGRFFLLGSASPDVRRQSAESLAGRAQTLVLRPLALDEVGGQAQLGKLWMRGGFPEAFLAGSDPASMEWRDAYLRDLVDRDLRLLGFDLPPERMRRFMLLLAHLHGQLWNASELARALGIGANTAARYLDTICQTLLVRRLEPYYKNLGKRLVKAPKIYLADSGLAHALLGIPDKPALLGHPAQGASWEGFVLQHLDACLPAGWDVAFWRTSAGAEIDFLLLKNGRPEVAIEAKASETHPKPARGFHQGCEDLNISMKRRWLVYPGGEPLALPQGAEILPLEECLNRIRQL
jgi:predicted AAA+ superfamily ATPase